MRNGRGARMKDVLGEIIAIPADDGTLGSGGPDQCSIVSGEGAPRLSIDQGRALLRAMPNVLAGCLLILIARVRAHPSGTIRQRGGRSRRGAGARAQDVPMDSRFSSG